MWNSHPIRQGMYMKGIYLIKHGDFELSNNKWPICIISEGEIYGLLEFMKEEKVYWNDMKCISSSGKVVFLGKVELK